jgi:hypothetical protein
MVLNNASIRLSAMIIIRSGASISIRIQAPNCSSHVLGEVALSSETGWTLGLEDYNSADRLKERQPRGVMCNEIAQAVV